MNFNNLFWNKDLYKKYLNYLISIKEDKYQVFSSKLTKTKYKILGIKIPILRSIAKNILKSDIISFDKFIFINRAPDTRRHFE